MSIATDTATLIGVPTALDEIEKGAEVEIPGLDYTVIVWDTDTAVRRLPDGGRVHVVVLTFEGHDGRHATFEGAPMDKIRQFVPLDDTRVRAAHGELSKDETCDLVPALCNEVARLRAELASEQAKSDEARRMRADAEAEALEFRTRAGRLAAGVGGAL